MDSAIAAGHCEKRAKWLVKDEHGSCAYPLDYRTDRRRYVETFLDRLPNWDFVEANLALSGAARFVEVTPRARGTSDPVNGLARHVRCIDSGQMSHRTSTARFSIEIDAPVARVFAHWTRYEHLSHCMPSVRRVKRIDDRVLWDVDVAGQQVAWEAQIVELVPEKRVRWQTRWGARHHGEVSFEDLGDDRTRLAVEIVYRPRNFAERVAAWLGLVDLQLRRDVDAFHRFVERLPPYPGRAAL